MPEVKVSNEELVWRLGNEKSKFSHHWDELIKRNDEKDLTVVLPKGYLRPTPPQFGAVAATTVALERSSENLPCSTVLEHLWQTMLRNPDDGDVPEEISNLILSIGWDYKARDIRKRTPSEIERFLRSLTDGRKLSWTRMNAGEGGQARLFQMIYDVALEWLNQRKR
jgi:hypothetical protein